MMHAPEGAGGDKLTIFGLAWNSATLLLCSACLFWALNPIVARAVRALISPVALSFGRWGTAAVIVTIFAWPHLKRDWGAIVRSWRMLLLLSVLGIGLFSTLVYWGLQYTTAVNNLMMQAAMPSMILITAALLFGDRITPGQVAGAIVSLAGLLTIITRGSLDNLLALEFNRGDAAALGGVFLYSVYSAVLRKKPPIHPLSLLTALFWIGVAMLLPLLAIELVHGVVLEPRLATFGAILYVGIFPSLLAYFFFNRSVELIGAARAGVYMNLPPVFGIGLAIPLLGERLEAFHLAGAALVGIGIWTSLRKASGQTQVPPAEALEPR